SVMLLPFGQHLDKRGPHPGSAKLARATPGPAGLIQVMAMPVLRGETATMGNPIPIELNPVNEVTVDAALVAAGLVLEFAEFRRLMDERMITVLCERGTGPDAGLNRASIY